MARVIRRPGSDRLLRLRTTKGGYRRWIGRLHIRNPDDRRCCTALVLSKDDRAAIAFFHRRYGNGARCTPHMVWCRSGAYRALVDRVGTAWLAVQLTHHVSV